jgi:alkylated DNA nucleotide flippase Atl1
MSVHLKIEEAREGVRATLSQRDNEGKVIGHPSIGLVASATEARQLAKTLAQSLGLKVYRVIDKTKSASQPEKSSETAAKTNQLDADLDAAKREPPPWLVPGVGKSL